MTDMQQSSSDVAAIHALLERLVAAWNQGDGAAYGTCFTEDADYIDVTGTHTKGGEAIGRVHQFLFNGPLKGSQLEGDTYKNADITLLAPTVAIVIAHGNSRLAGQAQASAERASINTTILVKRDGRWLIRAFQNNRIQPMPFMAKPADSSGAPDQQ